MKTFAISLTAIAAFLIAGCAPPANTNTALNTANTNANANKTTAAAPTVDYLMSMDKAAQEAWTKGDSKWFEDNLSSKFISYRMGMRSGKADEVKMIGSTKCEMKSMNFTEPAMTKVNDDAYVLTYKAAYDGSCVMDGKTEKIPAEMRAATLVVREGDKWMGAWHGETPIMNPNAPPPAPADKKEVVGTSNTNAANVNSNSNASNSAPPTVMTPSSNTEALVKAHQAGWEAFKARDAKYFNDNVASNFGFADPGGGFIGSKAEAIKLWTETMKCEGITTVKFSEGFGVAVSPTVEVLTGKGTADGTCDGQKNGTLLTTAVYVKEGDAWKLAYMMESPAM